MKRLPLCSEIVTATFAFWKKEFSVTAVCRGTALRLSGEEPNVAAAARAVEGMLLLTENHTPLEDQTVHYCMSLAHDGKEKRVKELTEDFITVTVKGRPIRPKTLGQKEYLKAIQSHAITFGVAPPVQARPIWQ